MLYKFKVKKSLNLLEINNLNLNNLVTSSNISIRLSTKRSKDIIIEASSIKRSKVIRRFLVKRVVAIRVSLKTPSVIVILTINIFLAILESYRS